jgi:hypothetical protein
MDAVGHLDLQFWSLYLDYPLAEKLVYCYRQSLLHYSRPVSNVVLWLMALEQMKNPELSMEESATEALKLNVSNNMSSEELKNMVMQQLPHTVVRLKEISICMSEQFLVAETEEIFIHALCFDAWELAFIEKYPEIACSSTALKSLQIYCPIRYTSGSIYILTFLLRYDSVANRVNLRGRIYLRSTKKRSMNVTLDRATCQALHNLLFDLNATSLPQIPTVIGEKNLNVLTVRPGNALKFPVLCTFDFFKSRNYQRSYLSVYPPVMNKMHSYMSFSPEENLKEFIRTREMINMGDWLSQRVQPFDKMAVCPYAAEISEIDEKYAVRGGFIYGDAMVGKTHHMLQHIFAMTTSESRQTLYVVQPYDRKVVRTAIQCHDKDKLAGVYWDASDFSKMEEKKFYNQKVIIVNAKFLARSTSMQKWLSKFRLSRLVIDQFEKLDMKSKMAHFLKNINTDIVWLITSRLYVDILPTLYDLCRLNKYFVDSSLSRDYNLMTYAMFRQLSYHIIYGKNQLAVSSNRTVVTYARIELPRNHGDQYPLDQIFVSIRETLKKGTLKQMQNLLTLLSALDSGVAIRKREVDDMLLFYGFSVRVGGGVYVCIPPLIDIPTIDETVNARDVCPICQEATYEPIRNLSCHHVFCYTCLNEWNRLNSSCPCCRSEFRPEFFRVHEAKTDDVYSVLGKRREREDEKKNELVSTDELYVNHWRSHSLQTLLQQELFDKVLVITHWRQNLPMYFEAVKSVIPSDSKIGVISKKINYTECSATDQVVENSRVLITHADNVNYFRNDNRFRQVIFMDNDSGTESLENWYNYFRHTVSRIYHLTEGSLDKMYMILLDNLVRFNPVNNVTFPKMNSREILLRYQMYLRQ